MDTAVTKDDLIAKFAKNIGMAIHECNDHGKEYSSIPSFVWVTLQTHEVPPNCFICGKPMKKVESPTNNQFILWGMG
jgi:hypothetical protein